MNSLMIDPVADLELAREFMRNPLYRSVWDDSQVVVLNKRLVIVNPAAANVDNNQIRLEPLGAGRFKYMPTTGGGSVGETVYFDETPGKPMRMFVGDGWSTRIEK